MSDLSQQGVEDAFPDQDLEELYPNDDEIRAQSDENDPLRQPEVGRLVEPESGMDQIDTTAESIATDVGADDGDLAPEERAMHIVEDS
ncbi:MAG TPA: DUF5709 domain-containing protein [Acidimicrobiales bacterium]|nr:DUF5709 domain-containing protein [Acidimicrobiales bacterium]